MVNDFVLSLQMMQIGWLEIVGVSVMLALLLTATLDRSLTRYGGVFTTAVALITIAGLLIANDYLNPGMNSDLLPLLAIAMGMLFTVGIVNSILQMRRVRHEKHHYNSL